MKTLPENILKRMSKADRAKLGKSGLLACEAQARYNAKSEKRVHTQIENWLRLNDIFYVHSRTDRKTTNQVGLPDFLFAWPFAGEIRPVAVEVKVNGNKLSPEQAKVRQQMIRNWWKYFLVSSLGDMIEQINLTQIDDTTETERAVYKTIAPAP